MATLTVGPGQTYQTVADGIAAASDGDTIYVQAGTYTNDFAYIGKPLTLIAASTGGGGGSAGSSGGGAPVNPAGTSGRVVLQATQQIPNGKAILIIGATCSITGFDFTGATVGDDNGAGIRYEGGDLHCTDCKFYDNQNGILGGPPGGQEGTGTIRFDRCETYRNGANDGFTHNLYVGHVGHFIFADSFSHDARMGHLLKSRAHKTSVMNSRLFGNDSNDSYELDFPNGGEVLVTTSMIQQGPNTDNPHMIMYGAEGNLRPVNSCSIESCTLVDDKGSHTAIVNRTTEVIEITDNDYWGVAKLVDGPANESANTELAARPAMDQSPI